MIKIFINSSVQKWLHLGMFSLLVLLMSGLAAGCRHVYCDDGTKVKDKSECNDLNTKILSLNDLNDNYFAQVENVLHVRNITLSIEGLLVAAESEANTDFEKLQKFGDLQKNYGERLTVNWNGNSVVPAREGQLLTFAEWNSWNKSPLGANPMPTGAKGAAMWVVGANEYELFGENGASLIKGDPVLDINTNAELQNAPQAVEALSNQFPGQKIVVKVGKQISLYNGTDMTALKKLLRDPQITKKITWHNGQIAFVWGEDAVEVPDASFLYEMKQLKLLKDTQRGAKNYPKIEKTYTAGSIDSIPGFAGVSSVSSTWLNNQTWAKAWPDEIVLAGGNDVWNVGSIPNYVYDQPYGDITLTSGSKSERPGVTNADDRFMNHLDVPVASRASNAKFGFISTTDIDFAEYSVDIYTPPPQGPKRLDTENIDFGLNGNSGLKAVQSWLNNGGGGGEWRNTSSTNKNRTLNIKTDRDECKTSNGQPIVNFNWVLNQVFAANGHNANKKLIVHDCELFVDYPYSVTYIEYCGSNDQVFLNSFNINAYNTRIITELPEGKVAYGVYGQLNPEPSKTHISQPVKTTNTSKP